MTLETAIDRYYNYIYSYICGRSGKDTDYAEECSNYIFFLFSLSAEKISDTAVYAWLLKTADNKLKEYFRHKKKEAKLCPLDDTVYVRSDPLDITDLIITDEDIYEAKNKLLSLLSEEERRMYEDYFVRKLTYIQIAEAMGIHRDTAAKRIRIIRRKLEEEANKIFGITGAMVLLRIISALFDR